MTTEADKLAEAFRLHDAMEEMKHAVSVMPTGKAKLEGLRQLQALQNKYDELRAAYEQSRGGVSDAERYRWLRDNNALDDRVEIFIDGELHAPGYLDEQIDAAILAARTAGEGHE